MAGRTGRRAWAEPAWSGQAACRGSSPELPQALGARADLAELALDLLKLLDALLQARVGGEDRRHAGAAVQLHRGGEVERVQRLSRPQVLVRYPVHPLADLGQRGYQRARLAGEQRAAAVGGQLAVPRKQP